MEKPEIVKPLLSCLLSIQGLYASDATATFAVGFFDFCEFETKEYEKNFQRILAWKETFKQQFKPEAFPKANDAFTDFTLFQIVPLFQTFRVYENVSQLAFFKEILCLSTKIS